MSSLPAPQSRGSGDKKGDASAEEGAQDEMVVLHNKAEMNSMITTLFEDGEVRSCCCCCCCCCYCRNAIATHRDTHAHRPLTPRSQKLVVPTNPWANKSVLKGLGAGAKLLFGATGLTGAHLLRYLIKVRPRIDGWARFILPFPRFPLITN